MKQCLVLEMLPSLHELILLFIELHMNSNDIRKKISAIGIFPFSSEIASNNVLEFLRKRTIFVPSAREEVLVRWDEPGLECAYLLPVICQPTIHLSDGCCQSPRAGRVRCQLSADSDRLLFG